MHLTSILDYKLYLLALAPLVKQCTGLFVCFSCSSCRYLCLPFLPFFFLLHIYLQASMSCQNNFAYVLLQRLGKSRLEGVY